MTNINKSGVVTFLQNQSTSSFQRVKPASSRALLADYICIRKGSVVNKLWKWKLGTHEGLVVLHDAHMWREGSVIDDLYMYSTLSCYPPILSFSTRFVRTYSASPRTFRIMILLGRSSVLKVKSNVEFLCPSCWCLKEIRSISYWPLQKHISMSVLRKSLFAVLISR